MVSASQSNETQETCNEEEEDRLWIRIKRVPVTPEGLRFRPSVESLRREFSSQDREECPTWSPLPFRYDQEAGGHSLATGWTTSSKIQSPQISNNSFYDRYDQNDCVAQSPNLQQAKTAVGALVASLTSHGGDPRDQSFSSLTTRASFSHRPYLPLVDDAETDNNSIDPVERSRTPHKIHQPSTPESMAPSPSSLTKPYQLVKSEAMNSELNNSYSSREQLIRKVTLPPGNHTEHKANSRAYDFAPLIAPDHVNVDEQTLVSGMSQSEVFDKKEFPSSPLDSELRLRKEFNQRRFLENLVYSSLERLHDNISLVIQVENQAVRDLCDSNCWFLQTPIDQEGLLIGFSRKSRDSLVHNLEILIEELDNNNVIPEEFMMSPTHLNEYVVEHTDLRDALRFCRNLVRMAVLEKDGFHSKATWKCIDTVRNSIGVSPASPIGSTNGGDTSVFSMPESAETPMTSNVSVGGASGSQNLEPKTAFPNGECVRRGIEMLSTLVERLSVACRGLVSLGAEAWKSGNADVKASVRFTEDIKRIYFQILGLNTNDLKALIDSFHLEGKGIARQVTDDEEDKRDMSQPILPPPELCRGMNLVELDDTVNNLFSPATDDMKTWNSSMGEFDDLRRSVGSVERPKYAPQEVRQAPSPSHKVPYFPRQTSAVVSRE